MKGLRYGGFKNALKLAAVELSQSYSILNFFDSTLANIRFSKVGWRCFSVAESCKCWSSWEVERCLKFIELVYNKDLRQLYSFATIF